MSSYSEFHVDCNDLGDLYLNHICCSRLNINTEGKVPSLLVLCDIHKCPPKSVVEYYYHWDGTERKKEFYAARNGATMIEWLEDKRESDYYLKEKSE